VGYLECLPDAGRNSQDDRRMIGVAFPAKSGFIRRQLSRAASHAGDLLSTRVWLGRCARDPDALEVDGELRIARVAIYAEGPGLRRQAVVRLDLPFHGSATDGLSVASNALGGRMRSVVGRGVVSTLAAGA
jgi:hypothetical protein